MESASQNCCTCILSEDNRACPRGDETPGPPNDECMGRKYDRRLARRRGVRDFRSLN